MLPKALAIEGKQLMAEERTDARDASHGERMLEIKPYFWTDGLAEKGKVIPKHAWSAGMVSIERNKTHGIVPSRTKPFNSLLDIGSVIEKVLIEHGVVLHPSKKMKKYVKDKP